MLALVNRGVHLIPLQAVHFKVIQMVHFILIYPVHLKVIWAVHLKCCNQILQNIDKELSRLEDEGKDLGKDICNITLHID